MVQIAHVGNTFFTSIHHEEQAAGGVALLISDIPVRKLWLIYDVPAHAARVRRNYKRNPEPLQAIAAANRFLIQEPGDCVVFSNGAIHSVLTEFGNTEFDNMHNKSKRPFISILLGCCFHAPDPQVVSAAMRSRFSRPIIGSVKRMSPRIRPYTKPELRKQRFRRLAAKGVAAKLK